MYKEWLDVLKNEKCLTEREMKILCSKVKEVLVQESNVHYVSAPVVIVGDIHGQFFDLMQIFEIGGNVPDSTYVFLGDYVDRGYHSVETFSFLLTLKLLYPKHIVLLRGNHETRGISQQYGLYLEITKKYGNPNPWKYICDVFDYLPMAAVIDGKVFCVHGGLSPRIAYIDQIRTFNRFCELNSGDPLGDLCWSDPDDRDIVDWRKSPRGAGWTFGSKIVKEFNYLNSIELICRSHQLVMEGFKYYFNDTTFLNVWSAPNYTYTCGNKATILKLDSNLERSFEFVKDDPKSKKSIPPSQIIPYFL